MSDVNKSRKCICGKDVKVPVHCGSCERALCRSCVEFVGPQMFSFMSKIPNEISAPHYCSVCYVAHVQPARRAYADLMRKAKEIYFIDKPRRKPLPILKKSTEELRVENCDDREETVLRLGFLAAERGFNAVIKAKVDHKKVRNFGYQTTVWFGNGFPAELDSAKLEKRDED